MAELSPAQTISSDGEVFELTPPRGVDWNNLSGVVIINKSDYELRTFGPGRRLIPAWWKQYLRLPPNTPGLMPPGQPTPLIVTAQLTTGVTPGAVQTFYVEWLWAGEHVDFGPLFQGG